MPDFTRLFTPHGSRRTQNPDWPKRRPITGMLTGTVARQLILGKFARELMR